MKITKELLERHSMGLCTEEEKKAVEAWFETLENPSVDAQKKVSQKLNRDRIWSRLLQGITEFEKTSSYRSNIIVPLHRRLTKYAAAACIVFAAFFGGRFSTGTANATEIVNNSPKDMLYIYGGNGAEAHVPGSQYKIKFDGQVKLFNSSMMEKKINVGRKTFVLNPYGAYYLKGSTDDPVLFNDNPLSDKLLEKDLRGGFSILRTKQ